MKLTIGDLLEYRSALYGGRNIPIDVQIFFVENELRKVEVIAGTPCDLFGAPGNDFSKRLKDAIDYLRSASSACDDAESACDEVLSELQHILKEVAV